MGEWCERGESCTAVCREWCLAFLTNRCCGIEEERKAEKINNKKQQREVTLEARNANIYEGEESVKNGQVDNEMKRRIGAEKHQYFTIWAAINSPRNYCLFGEREMSHSLWTVDIVRGEGSITGCEILSISKLLATSYITNLIECRIDSQLRGEWLFIPLVLCIHILSIRGHRRGIASWPRQSFCACNHSHSVSAGCISASHLVQPSTRHFVPSWEFPTGCGASGHLSAAECLLAVGPIRFCKERTSYFGVYLELTEFCRVRARCVHSEWPLCSSAFSPTKFRIQ